jgi:KUP system potassium uptake protein
MVTSHPAPAGHQKPALPTVVVAAIGIVFGDIGTSVLYALRETFNPVHGIPLNSNTVLGVISLLFWALVIVVAFKYVLFVMRADNNGEGGALALMTLSLRRIRQGSRAAAGLMMLGLFGACMFYGDAVIAPAISVMSAVEGLSLVAPHLSPAILPITLIILSILFWLQRHGTAAVGRLFGPVMLIWFATLATLGLWHIVQAPEIIQALNPVHALYFISHHGWQGYLALGSIFLVLTGAEALYVDIGHFGAHPIRLGWYSVVMPALMLNYFGQGALLLNNAHAIENPFYLLAPSWALLPLVILATLATIIASQAVISGAFSLTAQAIRLGYVPRMKILHTSERAIGQIYIPFVNGLLLVVISCIVIGFKRSDHLAAAYGIAVSTTMVITTILACVVMVRVWRWSRTGVALLSALFLTVDIAFFGANMLKLAEGGWLPLSIGAVLFLLLMTWYKGQHLVKAHTALDGIALQPFISSLLAHPPHRVAGTAVYLTGSDKFVPVSLLHNLKHNKVLHQQTVLLHFITQDVPYIDAQHRIEMTALGPGIVLVCAAYGFNETPDVLTVLRLLEKQHGIPFELMATSFFLARETIVPTRLPGMSVWRERIFAWMHQNAAKPTDFFKIPANRVVELGTKIEI